MTGEITTQVVTVRQRLALSWVHRPFTMTTSVILLLPGVLALIYGSEVSRAFTTIGAAIVIRMVGAALLAGGFAVIVGIARGRTLMEVAGLSILAAGCGVYGIGVILGLGLGGVVAGCGFLAIAVASVRQVITMATLAPPGDGSE